MLLPKVSLRFTLGSERLGLSARMGWCFPCMYMLHALSVIETPQCDVSTNFIQSSPGIRENHSTNLRLIVLIHSTFIRERQCKWASYRSTMVDAAHRHCRPSRPLLRCHAATRNTAGGEDPHEMIKAVCQNACVSLRTLFRQDSLESVCCILTHCLLIN